jgi:hypothetical protein
MYMILASSTWMFSRRRHRCFGHVLMVGLILGYHWWREEATQVPPWYRRSP